MVDHVTRLRLCRVTRRARALWTRRAASVEKVTAVLWTSPVGVASLIAAAVVRACAFSGVAAALGLWAGTVLAGLALFGGVVLPGVLWAVARKPPLATARAFGAGPPPSAAHSSGSILRGRGKAHGCVGAAACGRAGRRSHRRQACCLTRGAHGGRRCSFGPWA